MDPRTEAHLRRSESRRNHAVARARQEEPPLPPEYTIPSRDLGLKDLAYLAEPKPKQKKDKPKMFGDEPRISNGTKF